MDESIFYIAEGDPSDKHSTAYAVSDSIHTSHQHAIFRQANSPRHGSCLSGIGQGERLFVAVKGKALIHVYAWGKESPDQRIPVPEQLTCLAVAPYTNQFSAAKARFRTPWLLAGGGVSGKIYIWEMTSGLLVAIKEAHYQSPTVLKFSPDGSYLISGGSDSRIIVWDTLSLISIYNDNDENIKPFATISDHSLSVTDLLISPGISGDMKLYSSSTDGTIRAYDLKTSKLLTTFVLPSGVESITKDPAGRTLFAGLSNGLIRTIPLYVADKDNILRAVGGCGKIITIDADPSLSYTFVHHLNSGDKGESYVTALDVSIDGTLLISGDSIGRVFVSDIVSRQIVKAMKPLETAISGLKCNTLISNSVVEPKNEKAHRLIPQFKRVLAANDIKEHILYTEIPSQTTDEFQFDSWIEDLSQQELQFKNLTDINSSVHIQNSSEKVEDKDEKISTLESQLEQLTKAYVEMKKSYQEIFASHTKLINQ